MCLLTVIRSGLELGRKCSKEGAPCGCHTRVMEVRTALFWNVTQCVAVITYRLSGQTVDPIKGHACPSQERLTLDGTRQSLPKRR